MSATSVLRVGESVGFVYLTGHAARLGFASARFLRGFGTFSLRCITALL